MKKSDKFTLIKKVGSIALMIAVCIMSAGLLVVKWVIESEKFDD